MIARTPVLDALEEEARTQKDEWDRLMEELRRMGEEHGDAAVSVSDEALLALDELTRPHASLASINDTTPYYFGLRG